MRKTKPGNHLNKNSLFTRAKRSHPLRQRQFSRQTWMNNMKRLKRFGNPNFG
ncbi:hypothetical protein P879_11759 [Paragonimus westermani]|uniref:Uncharacterized protein n=1 Tax=Paragonimus westermani TaxID=34504 RepID=A0A8T0DAR9_9TREM|nr:hypothetical protein P879_11759 [Paragonimus westermani]